MKNRREIAFLLLWPSLEIVGSPLRVEIWNVSPSHEMSESRTSPMRTEIKTAPKPLPVDDSSRRHTPPFQATPRSRDREDSDLSLEDPLLYLRSEHVGHPGQPRTCSSRRGSREVVKLVARTRVPRPSRDEIVGRIRQQGEGIR
jgi:hypothetical protein